MSQTITETNDSFKIKSVKIRSYPNTVYLWPTAAFGFIIYLVDYIYNLSSETPIFADPGNQALVATIWFLILFSNLIVMSFDFKLGKAVLLFLLGLISAIVYVVIIDKFVPTEIRINEILKNMDIGATANFYILFTIILVVLFFLIWISSLFSYWEISRNRITHHKGFLEREENFNAQNSRVVTSLDDIFERFLFRAGTISIVDPEKNVHILRNVYRAVGKDKEIQKILSVIYTEEIGKD